MLIRIAYVLVGAEIVQQTLSNASVTDFLIVEYLDDIGGRVAHADFGSKPDGTPYVIELGANWVQILMSLL